MIQFNILILTREEAVISHKWISTQLYPWRLPEVQNALKENGFNRVQYFSDLSRKEFDVKSSQNLVVFAQ